MKFFLLMVLLLSASCTKFGKNVTIKGRVVNPITGEGIEGAEIWLQKTAGVMMGVIKQSRKRSQESMAFLN